jgi:hypothetical protein
MTLRFRSVAIAALAVFALAGAAAPSPAAAGIVTFTNYTTTNGLGNNNVRGVYAIGSTVYAATQGGLSISTNGGANFTNYTTTNGLGNNIVNGVYASGSTVYAATNGGLSIATIAAVPEPSTWVLAVIGSGAVALKTWRRRRTSLVA